MCPRINTEVRRANRSVKLPGSLQHHDCVLPLVRARGGELHIDVGQAAAARVAVAAAGHAAHLDAGIRHPGSEGLQARRQCMKLHRGEGTASEERNRPAMTQHKQKKASIQFY